jgi:hypothetical protein
MGADEFNPDQLALLPVVLRLCELLYQDEFSNPDSGWPIIEESDYRMEYLEGEYRLWLDFTNGWLAASPDFTFADYALSVNARKASGGYASYGLIFGLSNDWQEFHTFEIDPQGNFGIFRYNHGEWLSLADGFLPLLFRVGPPTTWNPS